MKHDLLAISANGLRSSMSINTLDLSFENLHLLNKKCTPNQIMLYQLSMSLHKIYNIDSWHLNFETITVIDQMILSSRQVNFQILRNNRRKIGLNTTANKIYHLNNQIGLERLNLNFAHFKKLSKIQFLKYGNTWSFRIWMPGVHSSPNGHESKSYEAVFGDVMAYLLLYNQLNYELNCEWKFL